jgi:hypothetical protein
MSRPFDTEVRPALLESDARQETDQHQRRDRKGQRQHQQFGRGCRGRIVRAAQLQRARDPGLENGKLAA